MIRRAGTFRGPGAFFVPAMVNQVDLVPLTCGNMHNRRSKLLSQDSFVKLSVHRGPWKPRLRPLGGTLSAERAGRMGLPRGTRDLAPTEFPQVTAGARIGWKRTCLRLSRGTGPEPCQCHLPDKTLARLRDRRRKLRHFPGVSRAFWLPAERCHKAHLRHLTGSWAHETPGPWYRYRVPEFRVSTGL